MTRPRHPTSQTSHVPGLITALTRGFVLVFLTGLLATACATAKPVTSSPTKLGGVDLSNIEMSPTNTHLGAVGTLSFDLDAEGSGLDQYYLSLVLRSSDVDATLASVEVEGFGDAEERPLPIERTALRFERQIVTFEANSDNQRASVVREFPIPSDAATGTYEVVLQSGSDEYVLPQQLTLIQPTEPDLVVTNVSLSNNSFELLFDESNPIDLSVPPPVSLNIQIANTGTATPAGTPIEVSSELTCGDITLALPLGVAGAELSDRSEVADSLPRDSVKGISLGLYLPTEAYVAWLSLTEEVTCEFKLLITPGDRVVTLPLRLLPNAGIGDGLQANARQAASPWTTVYDLATTLGASASGMIGANNSVVVFNTSYTVLPNFLKYKVRDLGGFSDVPLGVDFRSNFNTTLNVGLLGFNGAFVLLSAEALLTVDAEELLGIGEEACDPGRPAVKLAATAFDEDVFPPFELPNPCPPEVDIPDRISVSKSFDLVDRYIA